MDSTTVSNIDDLLMGGQGNSQQPPTPEHTDSGVAEIQEATPEESNDTYGLNEPKPQDDHVSDPHEASDEGEAPEVEHPREVDDYGNETENMTDGMKKRLKKQADKYENRIEQLEAKIAQLSPHQQQQLDQAAQNFQADPNSDEDWQRQFETMVEQTVHNIQSKKQQEIAQAEEIRIQQEFERKLFTGADRFDDFRETIRDVGCEISDHMTHATRSLEDPAAFLYAAAKRHPAELKRISELRDPYAQVREMGKLEERMRKGKTNTTTPRPLGKPKADASVPHPAAKKNESFDEILAKNDAQRLAKVRQRTGRK